MNATGPELTPGALGRLALHADVGLVAAELLLWDRDDARPMAAWFRALAERLEERAGAPVEEWQDARDRDREDERDAADRWGSVHRREL